MPQFPYQFFDNFVVRTPLLSCKDFQETFSEESTNDEKIQKLLTDNTFREAIYLASPFLFREMEKWLSGKIVSRTDEDKLKNTILKYYSRISTRCTPFGMFAGVGLGHFDYAQQDKIKSTDTQFTTCKSILDTKLDMHFLVALSKHFEKIPEIKTKLSFFFNNSIYKIGDKIRYVEYEYSHGKRDYIISSARLSKELQQVLDFSKQGKTIEQIANNLFDDEITKEDSTEFIEELIENQVLVSELEPNVAGIDFLDSIISILEKIGANKEKDILVFIKGKTNKLDAHIGNPISAYADIEELIKSLNIDYEQKYLFQSDLYFDNEIKLSYHWKKKLKKGISFLNKITQSNNDTYLKKFKKAFSERFENEEVPLSFALDTEVGIGYRQDIQAKAIHPYLEDLTVSASKEKKGIEIKLNPVQIIFNQKLQDAFLGKDCVIKLTDNDFKGFEENWNDLPETMSFMAETILEKDQEKLFLNGGSGNAGKLLARFCSDKSQIRELVKETARKEEELKPDHILAEIIHLPESRIGNILRRPNLRNYEIPYLAKSLLPDDYQIPIDDLYISIKNDKLILRSSKHNKEIIPYLTNAHNYSVNSLPIYHFLCDLNIQNIRSGLYFDWGGLAHIYNFLPRVEYENMIFSKAQWKINSEEIKQFASLLNNENKTLLIKEIVNWRNKRQIPKWVQWVKSDNILVINLENEDLLSMFLDSVKNEKEIVVEEFLYDEQDNFTHQFIFPIYKISK